MTRTKFSMWLVPQLMKTLKSAPGIVTAGITNRGYLNTSRSLINWRFRLWCHRVVLYAGHEVIMLYFMPAMVSSCCTLCRLWCHHVVLYAGYGLTVLYFMPAMMSLCCTLCRLWCHHIVLYAGYGVIVLYFMPAMMSLCCTLCRPWCHHVVL